MKKIYGLFVGIDEYGCGAHLGGCVNDATHMLNYMQKWADSNGYDLKKKLLFSPMQDKMSHFKKLYEFEPATRNNILVWFQKHFLNADNSDIVFFFFAGHGSTEAANVYFEESNGKLNTLVCHDSRTKDSNGKAIKDILDKEIRFLVRKVWEKTGAEIVLIQDSCHSAGASRDIAKTGEQSPRFVSESQGRDTKEAIKRSANEFLLIPEDDGSEETNAIREIALETQEKLARFVDHVKSTNRDIEKVNSKAELGQITSAKINKSFEETFPEGQHIHFGACAKDQFAYEGTQFYSKDKTVQGGNFTHSLINTLQRINGKITYQALRPDIEKAVQQKNAKQTPVLTIVNDDPQKNKEYFLNPQKGENRIPVRYLRYAAGGGGWFITTGGCDGLKIAQESDPNTHIPFVVLHDTTLKEYPAKFVHTLADKTLIEFTGETPATEEDTAKGLYAILDQSFFRRVILRFGLEVDKNYKEEKPLFEQLCTRLRDNNSGYIFIPQVSNSGGFSAPIPKIVITHTPENADFIIKFNEKGDGLLLYKNLSTVGTTRANPYELVYEEKGIDKERANNLFERMIDLFDNAAKQYTRSYTCYCEPAPDVDIEALRLAYHTRAAHFANYFTIAKPNETSINFKFVKRGIFFELVRPAHSLNVLGKHVNNKEKVLARVFAFASNSYNILFDAAQKISTWATMLLLSNQNAEKDFNYTFNPQTNQYDSSVKAITAQATVEIADVTRTEGDPILNMATTVFTGDVISGLLNLNLEGKTTLIPNNYVFNVGESKENRINVTTEGFIEFCPNNNNTYKINFRFELINNYPQQRFVVPIFMDENFRVKILTLPEKGKLDPNSGDKKGNTIFSHVYIVAPNPTDEYLICYLKVIHAHSEFFYISEMEQEALQQPPSVENMVVATPKEMLQRSERSLPDSAEYQQSSWGTFNFRLVFKNPYYKG